MAWHAEGISMEAVMRGVDFFDAQFGVTSTTIEGLGQAICGTKDLEDSGRVRHAHSFVQ